MTRHDNVEETENDNMDETENLSPLSLIVLLDHIRCKLISNRVSGETPGGIFT